MRLKFVGLKVVCSKMFLTIVGRGGVGDEGQAGECRKGEQDSLGHGRFGCGAADALMAAVVRPVLL
jgi:hypothetical protein